MNHHSPPEPFVSMNALLFVILPIMGGILVTSGVVGFYNGEKGGLLGFGLWSIITGLVYLGLGSRPSETSDRRRWRWALISTIIMILGLTARQIIIRPGSPRPYGIYDGAVQSEVAADFLIHGKNPYGANYYATPYGALNLINSSGVGTINAVWYHYIYPPLTFLVYVPIRIVQPILGRLADYRLVTLAALGALTWLLVRRAKTWSAKTTAVLLTLGNPLLWLYVVIGANEILVTLCIVSSALSLLSRRWLLSGLLLGAAIASKQVAWLLIPLWLYWLWVQVQHKTLTRPQMRRILLGAALSVAILFLPFFLWSPIRTWTDLFIFASGSIPNTYPLAGSTFLQYLHVFHIVATPWSPVPVYLFQLLIGLPMLVLCARWIRADSGPARWLATAAIFLTSELLVSRYLNNNFFTTTTALIVVAYLLEGVPMVSHPTPDHVA